MSNLQTEISRWCEEQLSHWEAVDFNYTTISDVHNTENPNVALFEISESIVSLRSVSSSASPAIRQRIQLYQSFMELVLERHGSIGHRIFLRLDASDEPTNHVSFPTFSFQKQTGFSNILLPDVDFFYHNFYISDEFSDDRSYDQKSNTAVFAGSTTGGGHITQEKIELGLVPRIKSAIYFSNHSQVEFRLPRLVQLDRPETESKLREMGFGVGEMTWNDQLRHRFLISLDGNGATCSRLFVGLRSNSVLLKYSSSSELFYFSSLVPEQHFIPIECDEDVLQVISKEEASPGYHVRVSEASREFCKYFLNREAIELYTHQLLSRYSSLVIKKIYLDIESQTSPGPQIFVQPSVAVSNRLSDVKFLTPLKRLSMPESIPDHTGIDYHHFIANVHRWLLPDTYLEVGVEQGHTFKLSQAKSIGIDPAFKFTDVEVFNSLLMRPIAGLYQMTSDEFFRNFDPSKILGSRIDLAFLDGMHLCEYLLRDFIHTERYCRSKSTIMLHDCCPLEAPMAARQPGLPAVEAHHEGWWTGDVWRTALALKRFRPDLKITAFDAAPTGLICITNLNPDSTYLSDNYFKVVDDMRHWLLNDIGLDTLMTELGVLSTDLVSTEEKMKAVLSIL